MQGYFADAYHFLPNKNTKPVYIGTHFSDFAQDFLLYLLSFNKNFFNDIKELGARDEFTMNFCDKNTIFALYKGSKIKDELKGCENYELFSFEDKRIYCFLHALI